MKNTPEYEQFLTQLQELINQSRLRAVLTVNREMLMLYWQIGKHILDKQAQQGWGAKVIDNLAKDLSIAFPDMKGFSLRNLKYMRKFAEAYPDLAFVQPVVAQLSWTHHIILLDKFADEELRLWYIRKSAEQGWSKRVLMHQIDLQVHKVFGALPNNFAQLLPPLDSDLAKKRFAFCGLQIRFYFGCYAGKVVLSFWQARRFGTPFAPTRTRILRIKSSLS